MKGLIIIYQSKRLERTQVILSRGLMNNSYNEKSSLRSPHYVIFYLFVYFFKVGYWYCAYVR